jgi:hypothetical protein
MHRFLAARCAALFATGAAVSLLTIPAHAQSYPGDAGAGVQRGIQQLNNSGQVGTVTLFEHARDALVFVQIHGAPHAESVRVVRGADCDSLAPAVAFVVSDLHGGVSRSLVHAGVDRLLSGNYNVVVYGSTALHAGPVACGHLYAR